MNTIKLVTRDGQEVAEVEVPLFKSQPDVIVWGTRYFLYGHINQVWHEVFAYVVPMKVDKGTGE